MRGLTEYLQAQFELFSSPTASCNFCSFHITINVSRGCQPGEYGNMGSGSGSRLGHSSLDAMQGLQDFPLY